MPPGPPPRPWHFGGARGKAPNGRGRVLSVQALRPTQIRPRRGRSNREAAPKKPLRMVPAPGPAPWARRDCSVVQQEQYAPDSAPAHGAGVLR